MEEHLRFLTERITAGMPLADILDTFAQMCQVPLQEDMILFETGTFEFLGPPHFLFSLVRQVPNDDEEFVQLHVDVHYDPTAGNSAFSESTWDEDLEENIFDYIRNSPAFAYAQTQDYLKVEVYLDQT